MGRRCATCDHPKRKELERRLIDGEPANRLAHEFGLSHDSILRHREKHITPAIRAAAEAARAEGERQAGEDHFTRLEQLNRAALAVLARAFRIGNDRMVILAAGEARKILETSAKLRGDLTDAPVINVIANPQFISIRTKLIAALEPFPAAREAVLRALEAKA